MASFSFIQILQLPIRGVANCVQRVYINRVSFEQSEDGKSLVRKQRSWFAWPLIFLGNIVFRFRRVPSRVLHKGEWIQWERILKLALRNEPIPEGFELLCEKIPGRPLSEILGSPNTDAAKRLALIKNATRALKKLHNKSIELSGFEMPVVLSHGDAAISNVLHCEETNHAEWFDFDLRHDLRVGVDQRHADDLRSLIFTASIFCQPEELESLVVMVKLEYQCERVWAALQSQVSSGWFWLDLFHLSQAYRLRASSQINENDLADIDEALMRLILENK